MRRKLIVTQADIDKAGGSHSAAFCPFAVAAKRQFPAYARVSVTQAVIACFRIAGSTEYWELSGRAADVIKRYDRTDKMGPGTYYITRGGIK